MEKNEISFEGVAQPHDRVVKWSFGRAPVAAGFFRSYSPEPIARAMNWDGLLHCPGSFVDPELVESHTDLLFQAPLLGSEETVYFYFLFEHLTNPDRLTSLRLAQYKLDIWKKWRAENPKPPRFELPYILAFVVHQGEDWTQPNRISGLMKRPEQVSPELISSLQEMELDMGYIAVTVPKGKPEELKGHILGRITLGLMSAARENRCLEYLEKHGEWIEELLREDDSLGMLRTLLRYIFQVDPHSWKRQHQVIQQIKSQIVKENVMTLAESLKKIGEKIGEKKGEKKGERRGRKAGLLEVTTQLLEDAIGPVPDSLAAAVGKLSPELLTTLARAAHTFQQKQDLEKWLRENEK